MKRRIITLSDDTDLSFEQQYALDMFGILLPRKMAEYFTGCYATVEVRLSQADAINGYGTNYGRAIYLMRPFEKCNNCSFHSLFNPNPVDSRCCRHTYGKKGWEYVFACDIDKLDLEHTFEVWLEGQPKSPFDGIRYGSFHKPSDVVNWKLMYCREEDNA